MRSFKRKRSDEEIIPVRSGKPHAVAGQLPQQNIGSGHQAELPPNEKPVPRPNSQPSGDTQSSEPDNVPSTLQDGASTQEDAPDIDTGVSEFYNSLYTALHAYGVTVPSLDELYDMLEAFLRPSIDAAIEARYARGETNMAELDADAYARGMGGSSYLSSMKAREMDDIQDDITELEAAYSAELAEYLFDAVNELQQLEIQLSMSASHNSSGGGGGSSSGTGGYGHNSSGSYFDGEWHEGDFSYLESDMTFEDYCEMFDGLSSGTVYRIFTENEGALRDCRWQMQYNLTQQEYIELMDRYFRVPTGGGSYVGGSTWQEMLF